MLCSILYHCIQFYIIHTHAAWLSIMEPHPGRPAVSPPNSAQGPSWTTTLMKAGLSPDLQEDYAPASM